MNLYDRYVKENGNKRYITVKTVINSENKIVKELLEKVRVGSLNKTYNEIKSISFVLGVDKAVKEMVNETFGKETYIDNPEGYIIRIDEDIQIFSESERGLFYGAVALLRCIEDGAVSEGLKYNYPLMGIRGIKTYIPPRDSIDEFKEFVDYCAYYGYNTWMMEIGGAMEYKSHPEINEGWVEYCNKFNKYPGQTMEAYRAAKWARNSIHMENGGGSFLTQEEVLDLIAYIQERNFKIIPEVPLLSHVDYLLTKHPELREREEDDLPDTYCPSNPQTYELVFDVLDEVIDVFKPEEINIGHDEFFSVSRCERCKDLVPHEVFANDIIKIYNYLKEKNIKTVIWSEMLLNAIGPYGESWGGSYKYVQHPETNKFLEIRPAIYPAIDLLPRDIILFHWFWGINRKYEDLYIEKGYENIILGNFKGDSMKNFKGRAHKFSGYVISNWSTANPIQLQRNSVFFNLAYTAYMQWSNSFCEENYEENMLAVSKDMYLYNRNKKINYIEVLHSTDIFKEHKPFVDGLFVDKDDDYIGKYVLTFKSGRKMEYNLYYNYNIGTSKAEVKPEDSDESCVYSYGQQLVEATYTCQRIHSDGKILYRTFIEIPQNEEVVSIEKKEDSKYGKNINLDGVYLKND